MIKFSTIGQIEHGEYPFESAVVKTDTFNGAFGTVADGIFTPSASGTKVIMAIESGDDAGMAKYPIKAGENVRVLDPSKVNGELEIYGYPLETGFKVNDTVGCFTVTNVIGNHVGAVVKLTSLSDSSVTDPTDQSVDE